MMNRVEMNEEMMAQVNGGGRYKNYRINTTSYPKNEPAVEAVAVEVSAGVEASENDDSFWGRLQKLL